MKTLLNLFIVSIFFLIISCGPPKQECRSCDFQINNLTSNYYLTHYIISSKDTLNKLKKLSYPVRITHPDDKKTPSYIKRIKRKSPCEVHLLNFLNYNDFYKIRGHCIDNVIYLQGNLKETNEKSVILGGTITKTNNSYEVYIRTIENFIVNDSLRIEKELQYVGVMNKKLDTTSYQTVSVKNRILDTEFITLQNIQDTIIHIEKIRKDTLSEPNVIKKIPVNNRLKDY